MAKYLEITLKRSGIGRPWRHKVILKSLGLTKLNKTIQLNDTLSVRGMVRKVSHLLEVKEIGD
jgi:large subunit ribosomal protein L30